MTLASDISTVSVVQKDIRRFDDAEDKTIINLLHKDLLTKQLSPVPQQYRRFRLSGTMTVAAVVEGAQKERKAGAQGADRDISGLKIVFYLPFCNRSIYLHHFFPLLTLQVGSTLCDTGLKD
ncbi:hypothetical protein CEXT_35501 [Caerostris extrusa]|uniref:Uncharacterized protein n=1 Tax=Caerostris extrusa TaxID=172846 RepID=A0AAV4UHJ4_CAEEX|nr:hypothetical protein CEXT_35501 [Caerostris extrusa]